MYGISYVTFLNIFLDTCKFIEANKLEVVVVTKKKSILDIIVVTHTHYY